MGIPVDWHRSNSAVYGGVGTGSAPYGIGVASVRPAAFTQGKLFLGGLDSSTTKETLLRYCMKWCDGGEITDAVVMDGRGFGFITFLDPKKAQQFLEQRNHTIDGKSVEAKAAVPKGVGSGSNLTKKLFVGGTGELTDVDFREYFKKFGDIQDAVIVRKQDGTSRGFGFVTFADELTVEKCLVIQHEIKGRKVDLRRAVPRDQMATQQAMYMGTYQPRYNFGLTSYGMGYPDMNMMAAYRMAPSYPLSMMPPHFANYSPYIRGQHIETSSKMDDRFGLY